MEPWIETVSGRKFWYTNLDPQEVEIEDIAHALSNMCRYTGHCDGFYSVAEHSVYVSHLTGSLEGLLHDASEAYLADIASPVKQMLPDYKILEERIMAKIAKRFNLAEGFEKSEDIKRADWTMLRKEAFHMLPSKGKEWYFPQGVTDPKDPSLPIPVGYAPFAASSMFLKRFYELWRSQSPS